MIETAEQVDDPRINVALKELVIKAYALEQVAARREVRSVWHQRLHYRGFQRLQWNKSNQSFSYIPYRGAAMSLDDIADDVFEDQYNLNQAYAKSFMATFCQNDAGSRCEAVDPLSGLDIAAAAQADIVRKAFERSIDMKMLQLRVALYLWTDGRVVFWTRTVVEDGTAHEITTPHGTLESKVQIFANPKTSSYVQIFEDCDLYELREEYANEDVKEDTISGKDENVDSLRRVARLSCTQASARGLSSDGNDVGVKSHTWFRPGFFRRASSEQAKLLREKFPEGCRVTMAGGVVVETAAEKMDDCITVMFPMEGDGQNRLAISSSLLPINDAFNDAMNITNETMQRAIGTTFVDQNAEDLKALNEQTSAPGTVHPLQKPKGESMQDQVYQMPSGTIPNQFMQWMQQLQGPLAQFVTGQMPSVFGGDMTNQDTAQAYTIARDQALGVTGVIWMPFERAWASVLNQVVGLIQNDDENDRNMVLPGEGGEKAIKVDIQALRAGQVRWYPAVDSSFPETAQQKSARFMELASQAATNPVLAAIMMQPDNMEEFKESVGLEDFQVPQAASAQKQIAELEILQATQAVADQTGQQVSSVPIDLQYDDHATEYAEVKRFVNSQKGQDLKKENVDFFNNCRLHGLEHQAAAQQQALAAQAAQAPQPGGAPQGAPPQGA